MVVGSMWKVLLQQCQCQLALQYPPLSRTNWTFLGIGLETLCVVLGRLFVRFPPIVWRPVRWKCPGNDEELSHAVWP